MRAPGVGDEAGGVEERGYEGWGWEEVCYQSVGLEGYEGWAEDTSRNTSQEGWNYLGEGRGELDAGISEVGVCGCEGAGEVEG